MPRRLAKYILVCHSPSALLMLDWFPNPVRNLGCFYKPKDFLQLVWSLVHYCVKISTAGHNPPRDISRYAEVPFSSTHHLLS